MTDKAMVWQGDGSVTIPFVPARDLNTKEWDQCQAAILAHQENTGLILYMPYITADPDLADSEKEEKHG